MGVHCRDGVCAFPHMEHVSSFLFMRMAGREKGVKKDDMHAICLVDFWQVARKLTKIDT